MSDTETVTRVHPADADLAYIRDEINDALEIVLEGWSEGDPSIPRGTHQAQTPRIVNPEIPVDVEDCDFVPQSLRGEKRSLDDDWQLDWEAQLFSAAGNRKSKRLIAMYEVHER